MKAKAKIIDIYQTTVVEVICPICGKTNTYEYPYDLGFFKTQRSEPCGNEECDTTLEFGYGKKKH